MKAMKLSQLQFEAREGYERSVVMTREDFSAPVKVQIVRVAPGAFIAPHYHKIRTECFKVLSGNGMIKINGETAADTPDILVLCKPGEVHEFINNSKEEYLYIQVIRTNDPEENDMFWEGERA